MLNNTEDANFYIFAKGEMADRTRSFNWSHTQLGAISSWPIQLLTTVNQILDSSFPMFIWWGTDKIQFYNDAYLEILGKDESSKHPKALGQNGAECWPEIWPVISPLLDRVLSTAVPVYLEDQLIPIYRRGILDQVYWTFSYNVIRNADGNPGGILVICSETTKKLEYQQQITVGFKQQEALNDELGAVNEELIASNEELNTTQEELQGLNDALEQLVEARTKALSDSELRFRSLVDNSPAAMLVFRGDDLILETVNEAMLQIIDKSEDVIGKPLLVGLPEIKGQPILDILYNVYKTGTPFSSPAIQINLNRHGRLESCYFNLSYRPLYENGKITGIIEAAIEVTAEIAATHQIERLNLELAGINEEQAASNEELAASNEELAMVNEELLQTQKNLNDTVQQLKNSNSRFQNLIREANVGIVVLTGSEMKVEIVNDAYGRMIGRSARELLNHPLFSVIPIAEPHFRPIIDQVRNSGESLYLYDTPYHIESDGRIIEGYLNVVYQQYKEADGNPTGVMVICQDTTEQVKARLKAKKADEMTKLAIEAARLGSWQLDPMLKTLVYNETLAELFGYEGNEPMTYEQAINQVTLEYRPLIAAQIEQAIASGGDYDFTYTQERFNDGKIVWLRSLGKVSRDTNGDIFSGFVMDITEQKKDEERKNHFIGIVSHELKTPITSINAYLQILQNKAYKANDTFAMTALSKSISQIKKMTTLINGFLNISRLESGKIHIDKQRFDMALLVKETEEESIATISSHKIVFAPVEQTFVNADRDKIGQVINNFISNSVKYSPPGSTINVACINIDNSIQVSVKDEGSGIAPQDTSKIFERFYRTETATESSVSGFGIGLYLCAEIIQHHGGNIWVNSEIGQGSIFYFTLPTTA
jgi:two-component system sensor histidine kinase VicK